MSVWLFILALILGLVGGYVFGAYWTTRILASRFVAVLRRDRDRGLIVLDGYVYALVPLKEYEDADDLERTVVHMNFYDEDGKPETRH